MITTSAGATILQRPALVRGIPQPGMGVHATNVIPTSQSFGIAGVPVSMAPVPNPAMIHPQPNAMASNAPSQMTPADAYSKGVAFFNKLITQMHIKSKKTSVQNLIQATIDGEKTPQEFATLLPGELGSNSGPQPQLVPFLDLALPLLRQAMNAGTLTLPGIRPPNMRNMPQPQMIQHIAQSTDNRVLSPVTMAIPTSMQSNDSPAILNASVTPTPAPTGPLNPLAPITPMVGQATTSTAKKKKIPLPPGQKSAYAIKKEAREARKREKELAAQSIKLEKTDENTTEIDQPKPVAEKSPTKPKPDKAKRQEKQKKHEKQLESLSATLRDDDDVNDVAAMGGVNLAEESQKIMASGAELVGTQIRSCKDQPFFDTRILSERIAKITQKLGLGNPSDEVVTLISHATQERLKDIVERLGVLAEHRTENLKFNPKYEISNDIKGQMKFLAELDRIEKHRYEEQERELLLRVAKSRSKAEDPEQQKLRQKAKDMQRAQQEEVRQQEANRTALLAIGPRKNAKANSIASGSFSQQSSSSLAENRSNIELRQEAVKRVKRVNMRDLQVLFEIDRTHLDRLFKMAAQ